MVATPPVSRMWQQQTSTPLLTALYDSLIKQLHQHLSMGGESGEGVYVPDINGSLEDL